MKTGLFHSIVRIESLAAILLVVTILLVIAYQTLDREMVLDAQTENWTTHCTDDRSNGGSSFTEDLSTSDAWSFSYTTQDTDRNSYAVFLISPPDDDSFLNLDWFSEITIRARAEGEDRQQFLLFLRDRPEHFDPEGDASSFKYNEAFIELTEQSQSIALPRECFDVPRWWISEQSILPKDASPSFSNLQWIELAVCCPNRANSGVVTIDDICFRGPLISPNSFYKLLFGTWSLLSIPLCIRFFSNIKKARAIRRIRLNQIAQQESGSKENFEAKKTKSKSSDTVEVQTIDELTGLLTKFGMQGVIDVALQEVRNGNTQANIILIDIDDMERLNRTNGMPAGDEMIRHIAGVIDENLPDGLKVCRWSGDKFLVVCHGIDRDESRKLACALRKCIDEETSATCSFGVHQLNPINSFEEAYERASKCVQEAKFNGKNKVVLFNLRSTAAPIASNNGPLTNLPQQA